MSQGHVVDIGALLISARNHAALTQKDVAARINLSLSTVRALESSEFEKLPESTYVRGYLRLYAKAVGIDAKGLVSAYDEQYHVESRIGSMLGPRAGYGSVVLQGTVVIITVLVGLLVVWWMSGKPTPGQDVELASDGPVVSPGFEDEAAPPWSAETGDTDNTAHSSVEKISGQSSPVAERQGSQPEYDASTSASVEQAEDDKSLSPSPGTLDENADVLTVTYTEVSWTEIKDADANLLMRGLIEAGTVRKLNGKAPFHVLLGNSPGVVVELNGQRFDHSRFKRSDRVAKFQVSSNSFN